MGGKSTKPKQKPKEKEIVLERKREEVIAPVQLPLKGLSSFPFRFIMDNQDIQATYIISLFNFSEDELDRIEMDVEDLMYQEVAVEEYYGTNKSVEEIQYEIINNPNKFNIKTIFFKNRQNRDLFDKNLNNMIKIFDCSGNQCNQCLSYLLCAEVYGKCCYKNKSSYYEPLQLEFFQVFLEINTSRGIDENKAIRILDDVTKVDNSNLLNGMPYLSTTLPPSITHQIPFYVTDKIDFTLKHWLEGCKMMTFTQKIGIMLQIAYGLQSLHDLKISHGSLDTSSIFVSLENNDIIPDLFETKVIKIGNFWNACFENQCSNRMGKYDFDIPRDDGNEIFTNSFKDRKLFDLWQLVLIYLQILKCYDVQNITEVAVSNLDHFSKWIVGKLDIPQNINAKNIRNYLDLIFANILTKTFEERNIQRDVIDNLESIKQELLR